MIGTSFEKIEGVWDILQFAEFRVKSAEKFEGCSGRWEKRMLGGGEAEDGTGEALLKTEEKRAIRTRFAF
jgi:hypothetical protein